MISNLNDLCSDARYNFIVDQQPIGRLLFRQFCEVSHKYQRYNNFLDLINKYEVYIFYLVHKEQMTDCSTFVKAGNG